MIDAADIAPQRLRPFTRAEYDQMVAMGLFAEERVELLAGTLVTMSPQGAPHAGVVRFFTQCLVPLFAGRALVQIQSPLALSAESEPEPDVAVVPLGEYLTEHPNRALWVIEVAESSLQKDRTVKAALYAAANVPEYWLVNLNERTVQVHTDPKDGAYRTVCTKNRADTLSPAQFPDIVIAIGDVLPAP